MQIMNPAQPGSSMKDQNRISGHLNGHGRTSHALSSEMKDETGYWNTPEHKFHENIDNFSIEKAVKDSVAANVVNKEQSHEDSHMYTDKDILDCDLPEVIVCYKDSVSSAVKDICVDEGVPTENKFPTETVMGGGRSSLPSDVYNPSDVVKEANNDLVQEGFRSSSYEDFKEGADDDCVNKGEVKIGQDTAYDCSAAGKESSTEPDKYQDSASIHTPETLFLSVEKECNAANNTTEHGTDNMLLGKEFRTETSLKSLLGSTKCGDNNNDQQVNQISCKQESTQGLEILKEPNRSSNGDNLLDNGELDSGISNLNYDNHKLAPSTSDEIHESAIRHQVKSENKLIHDDGNSENHLFTSNRIKHGGGESSFSAADLLSDTVPYSGHIPFSGSISLRSDSSTTSTRSFAFPVLQNEWNSSPVRMAKPDRRHFRKHRGCSLGLLCCRF